MVMGNDCLIEIADYLRGHYVEHAGVVERVMAQPFPFDRGTEPGHVTASAFILDATHERVLLIHHAGLDLWLQPGGHIDEGESPLQAAVRESFEEVGLHITPITGEIIDIDVHRIPANTKKNEPSHWHVDVRYLFVAQDHRVNLNENECSSYRWISLVDMLKMNQDSFVRVARKAILRKSI